MPPVELSGAALHGRTLVWLTPEDLTLLGKAQAGELIAPATEAKLAALSVEIGETRDVIGGVFRRLNEVDGLDEHWPEKLTRFAEDFRRLRAELKELDPKDANLKALRDHALAALEAGALDEAERLLRSIDADRDDTVAKAQKELLQAAEVKAALWQVALLKFSYATAAAYFHDAGDLLPGSETEKCRTYQKAEADALYRQGELFQRIDACLDEDADPYSDVAHFADGLKWAYAATE